MRDLQQQAGDCLEAVGREVRNLASSWLRLEATVGHQVAAPSTPCTPPRQVMQAMSPAASYQAVATGLWEMVQVSPCAPRCLTPSKGPEQPSPKARRAPRRLGLAVRGSPVTLASRAPES